MKLVLEYSDNRAAIVDSEYPYSGVICEESGSSDFPEEMIRETMEELVSCYNRAHPEPTKNARMRMEIHILKTTEESELCRLFLIWQGFSVVVHRPLTDSPADAMRPAMYYNGTYVAFSLFALVDWFNKRGMARI